MTFDHAALYGEDQLEPDVYAMHGLASGSVWGALSLGARAVLVRKAGAPVPNEDALCIAEDGARVLLAITDGHFGHSASHNLIERLDRALDARASSAGVLPRDLAELSSLVAACAGPAPRTRQPSTLAARSETATSPPDPTGTIERAEGRSETTLVVAVIDRAAREVWGVSVGDSSAVILGLETGVRWLTRPTRTFATPLDPATLAPPRLSTFRASLITGELVLVFSDGVNECEYGSPETSIGPRHLESLLIRAGGNPERFVDLLAQLALAGVDGHPGGEDNLALAAARV